MIVYLSGVSVKNTRSKEDFKKVQEELETFGYRVFNPYEFNDGPDEKENIIKRLERIWNSDMVILLQDSFKSKDLMVELTWANKFNIPIKPYIQFIPKNYNLSRIPDIKLIELLDLIINDFQFNKIEFLIRRYNKYVFVKTALINILDEESIAVNSIANLLKIDRTTVIHHRDKSHSNYKFDPEYKKVYLRVLSIVETFINKLGIAA